MDHPHLRHPPAAPPPSRPTIAEYLEWAERQPRRHELVHGEIVAMNAQRLGHIMAKTRVWEALRDAVRTSGLEAQAIGDGFAVAVGDDTAYEPDALVNLGPKPGNDDLLAPNPVIVVEVASPGTQSVDATDKLADYVRVPSIQHYLILSGRRREVVHHRRVAGDGTEARVVSSGPLRLDPPGITVTVEDFFVDLTA